MEIQSAEGLGELSEEGRRQKAEGRRQEAEGFYVFSDGDSNPCSLSVDRWLVPSASE
jgi:hypothetical protein